jgi:ribosome maturation factor RimP
VDDTSRRGLADELRPLVERVVESMGLELVELVLKGPRGKQTLRVDIDRAGLPGVGLEDCRRVSRTLSDALDEADPVPTKYVLEVSSPGADRPIRTTDDIRRNTGRRVAVEAKDEKTGETLTYRGKLVGQDGDCVVLDADGTGEIRISLDTFIEARQELEL